MSQDLSSGIVCLTFDDPNVQFGLVRELREAGFSTSISPYRDPYLRIGPSIVTSPGEVDALLDALRPMVTP